MARIDTIRDKRALTFGGALAAWPFAAFTKQESLGVSVPQLVRHQGMDVFDGFTVHAGTSLFAWALMSIIATSLRRRETEVGHLLPSIVGLGMVLALGIQTEVWHAARSGNPFDYPDIVAYITGALISATVTRNIHASSKE